MALVTEAPEDLPAAPNDLDDPFNADGGDEE